MDNRETSADVVFEYMGDGCSVPKDVISVRFNEGLCCKRLESAHFATARHYKASQYHQL